MKIKIDSDNHKDFKEIELTDNKNVISIFVSNLLNIYSIYLYLYIFSLKFLKKSRRLLLATVEI